VNVALRRAIRSLVRCRPWTTAAGLVVWLGGSALIVAYGGLGFLEALPLLGLVWAGGVADVAREDRQQP
jgi:hypothetical protein